jgi:hypothetical protein
MRRYTPEEIRFIKRKVAGRSYAELAALFNARFGAEVTVPQMGSTLERYGLKNGCDSRFAPGQVPHNKGKKKWWEGGEETQFKKGNRPWNWRPVGSERINAYGYAEVKVRNPKKWKAKHILVWEEANGKVPKGHVVIFADGDKTNFALSNLLLVSRSELAVMNRRGLIYGCADATKAGKVIADIRIKIAGRKREMKQSKTRRGAKGKR